MNAEYIAQIEREAVNAYPKECCGVITEQGVIPCENISNRPHTSYRIHPRTVQRIARRSPIVAIYHSHCDTDANPSEADLLQASWLNAVYIITSVGKTVTTRCYKLSGKKFNAIRC